MDTSKETFTTWNKIALLYEEKFMDLNLYNETYDFFCDSITEGNANILDVGCGPGNITKYLLLKRPDFLIQGIDIAPNMIDLAKKNNPAAGFEVMDIRDIGKVKSKFDGIVCGFCLPYLTEEESTILITDTANLLRDNGVIYISFVEGDKSESGFKVSSSGDRVYFNYHMLNNINKDLFDHGFDAPVLYKVDYHKVDGQAEVHTILITRKKTIV